MLASKYDRQMLSEFFIYSEDIILSPRYLKGWRIFFVTECWTKKSFKNSCLRRLRIGKWSGYVDQSPASQID